MSHFGDWFNYEATLKILLFSMLAGAALPGLFAVGIRLQAVGSGGVGADGTTSPGVHRTGLADLHAGCGSDPSRFAVHLSRFHRAPHWVPVPRGQA
jgi:hypothetical protein